jgi:hypothetical protein
MYLTLYFKVLCDFVFECSCVLIQVITICCNEKGNELGVTKKNSDSDDMELACLFTILRCNCAYLYTILR